ncbi:hypothetical protein DL89DRAFT_125242 [Linderina pennispora]|uniref:Uncharacterized protein n=1 Tax=Linderina pennispora TaxID=61395 RepID=A0A1Y1WDW0_9FUNG|nr:uncharacterized protein DL89DRAFT_125242 [Linderina pennispora]ORX71426.1 hypothetical protein DL89DRAFT_125242 [Linderina pennispora]
MQHCDEQWTERWEAMQAEHDQALAESERQVAKLRTELEVEKAVPRLSGMPESDAELKQKNVELKEENAELRRELEALKVSQQETRELAASQQESQELIASQQELKNEVEELRRQARAADARAQIAEEASAALAAKLAAQRDVTSPRMKDRSLSRQLSDKIVLRTRGSPSPRSSSSESDAQQFPGVPEEDDMTPPERRLWNMRNRHSATTPALPLSPAQPSSSDDKCASYPELRLASTARDSAIANAGMHRQAVYDEIQIQQMLKDAAAESDRQAGADKELRELRAKIEELREAKKELQQHNSQMKNIMRDLGDRLVKLAEENDMLEAKANERDSLIEEMRHMTSLVSEYEAKIHDLNVEAEVLRAARDKAEQACEAGRNDSKLGHRLSVESFRSAAEETPTASDTPRTQHSADSDNDEAAALRVRLDLAEAELKVALRSTDEYRNRVDILLGDIESYKQHIGSLETALASTDGQLDTTRREASELRNLAARAQELEAELGSQKTLVVCLKESLASSEEQTEEIKLNADRYANELLRAQAEAKSLGDQVELVSQQLMDARQLVTNEARDRDIWKSPVPRSPRRGRRDALKASQVQDELLLSTFFFLRLLF